MSNSEPGISTQTMSPEQLPNAFPSFVSVPARENLAGIKKAAFIGPDAQENPYVFQYELEDGNKSEEMPIPGVNLNGNNLDILRSNGISKDAIIAARMGETGTLAIDLPLEKDFASLGTLIAMDRYSVTHSHGKSSLIRSTMLPKGTARLTTDSRAVGDGWHEFGEYFFNKAGVLQMQYENPLVRTDNTLIQRLTFQNKDGKQVTVTFRPQKPLPENIENQYQALRLSPLKK